MWPEDEGCDVLYDKFDFIVVGAGSAGSVVGARLAVNPQYKVLVIEAGESPPIESEVPGLLLTLQNTKYAYNYTTEHSDKYCLAFNNGSCIWPRGRMIGGTGSLNGMIYLRGNPGDYNDWNVEGWKYEDVLPYFEKSQQFID
uniref:Glucose-methanol-choline oxidoreductase N-terminal domain-containing protein n=1 Tax=Megaselia scalaris TaxID=36166 RepID=T1GXP8_MEGSC